MCFIWIRREICTDETLFTSENSPKHGWTFYWRGEALLWARILTRRDILMMDLFLTNMQLFVSQDVNWWTGVVWISCVLLWCFISCLDSHSDGTHSLQMMHWCPSDVMLHFSKSVLMKKNNSSTSLFLGHMIFSDTFKTWICVINDGNKAPVTLHSTWGASLFSCLVIFSCLVVLSKGIDM